jgi:hypothetical protein
MAAARRPIGRILHGQTSRNFYPMGFGVDVAHRQAAVVLAPPLGFSGAGRARASQLVRWEAVTRARGPREARGALQTQCPRVKQVRLFPFAPYFSIREIIAFGLRVFCSTRSSYMYTRPLAPALAGAGIGRPRSRKNGAGGEASETAPRITGETNTRAPRAFSRPRRIDKCARVACSTEPRRSNRSLPTRTWRSSSARTANARLDPRALSVQNGEIQSQR